MCSSCRVKHGVHATACLACSPQAMLLARLYQRKQQLLKRYLMRDSASWRTCNHIWNVEPNAPLALMMYVSPLGCSTTG